MTISQEREAGEADISEKPLERNVQGKMVESRVTGAATESLQ